jgi:hypothetical protein
MEQLSIITKSESRYLSPKEASVWASKYLDRNITISNISYLVQYGRIRKYSSNGRILIDVDELKEYYDVFDKELQWKKKLGDDLNWNLSFSEYKESERTKHVHRLHPYKGKFIPQLVEYFLDNRTDEFKKRVYFQRGDIVLDPFCGSGTTLVQANELGIHSIGTDISAFNALISNTKLKRYDITKLRESISSLTNRLMSYRQHGNIVDFEEELQLKLTHFNNKFFPSPQYKRQVAKKEVNENEYSKAKEKEFLQEYFELIKKYDIELDNKICHSFLDKWFLPPVRDEIDFMFQEIKKITDQDVKKITAIILSRTVRSCRATTHADLGTLKDPVKTTYYCKKHGKICKPIFSIKGWWLRYSQDTLKRLLQFDSLRTKTYQICLIGDSRVIDLHEALSRKNDCLNQLLVKQKAAGIFSSPPYVGLINYHEQHAYSYELFGFERNDEAEIGSLTNGQGKEAKESYVKGIVETLMNCKKYLKKDYDVFLVANDKFNLYPRIAQLSGMKIVNQFKRPVLNRVEKDRSNAYSETIFHLKEG